MSDSCGNIQCLGFSYFKMAKIVKQRFLFINIIFNTVAEIFPNPKLNKVNVLLSC